MPHVVRTVLAFVLVVAPWLARADRAAPRQVDVSGTYRSNWNDVTLVQRGDRVSGTYVCCGGGTIEGRIVEGTIIRYRWKQPNGEGRGVWTIERDRLDGTWGSGASETDGGAWNLTRAPQMAQ